MSFIDWRCLVLSAISGVLLGVAVGSASHWAVGSALSMGWMALHGLTWGFTVTPLMPREAVLRELSGAHEPGDALVPSGPCVPNQHAKLGNRGGDCNLCVMDRVVQAVNKLGMD